MPVLQLTLPISMLALPDVYDPNAQYAAQTPTSFTVVSGSLSAKASGFGFGYDASGQVTAGVVNAVRVKDAVLGDVFEVRDLSYGVVNKIGQTGFALNGYLLGGALGQTAALFSGADSITGSNTRDQLAGFGGNDYIDGEGGIDSVLYAGLVGQYQRGVVSYNNFSVQGNAEGRDTLVDVERLQFLDRSVAIDLAEGLSGSNAVRFLTALVGADGYKDQALLGTALNLTDNLYPAEVADFVIDSGIAANLAGGSDTAQLIALLYKNVAGAVATTAQVSDYQAMFNAWGYDQAAILQWVVNLDETAARVDLAGLANVGVEYLPV